MITADSEEKDARELYMHFILLFKQLTIVTVIELTVEFADVMGFKRTCSKMSI